MLVRKYLRQLSDHTQDPIWSLVMALHSPQIMSLSEALDASRVPLDEFFRCRPSVYASDIDQATKNTLLSSHPSWLVLYLASFKVRSPANAAGPLINLSFAHTPPAVQRPLMVLTMVQLARFDLVSPMKPVIDAFLSVPLTHFQEAHFNLLLSAMTSLRVSSPQTGKNAVKVLDAMEARQLHLWDSTFSALLHDRHAALQLTSHLRRRQSHLGIVPTAAQLESYLRIYAADGAIHDAKRYADAIRDLRTGIKPDEEKSAVVDRANRRNTFLVRSQPDGASAFQFLLKLAAKTGRDRPFAPRERPSIHPQSLLGKRSVDIYDWSSALAVAANDRTISAKHFVQLFKHSRPKTSEFRATAASHTILIRGLLWRQAWELAYLHWTRLARSGLPLDDVALAAGLEATALSGRAGEAFELLDRPGLTTRLVNVLMAALTRILRPDLVFALWDALEGVYRLQPSNETLRIVLDAAQLPHVLDDSFKGQMALLAAAAATPFRLAPPAQPTRAAMRTQAETAYRSGVWRGRPAGETASRIFAQATLGTPERLHLARAAPPAHAVRAHAQSDGAVPSFRAAPPPLDAADLLAPGGSAQYPTLLALRDRDFHAHVMLLGMTRRAPEIPRTLGWMRALDVEPSSRTLGVALAFWSEVSVQPPLIAAVMERRGNGGQYARLVEWLGEWLREVEEKEGRGRGEGVPDEQSVGLWRARIERVRTQRRETIGASTRRLVDEEHIWKM